MAKVQFGSGVAYISGRVAGTVHARNKGGSYIRRFSVPVNPATTFQQNVRNALASSSAAWRNLTPTQQTAWQAWAATHPIIDRLGAAITLSGQQAYVALTQNAFNNGDGVAFYDVPPPSPVYEFPFEGDFAVVAASGGPTLTIGQTVQPAADTQVFVFASPPVSAGVTFVKEKVKFLGPITVLAATAVPVAVDVRAMWETRFGTFGASLIDKKIVFGLRTYNNGQLSGLVSSFGIVT
jgi:hypothetical protein